MASLNHMTHHSLPQQMVSMPFSQPQQQQQPLFQPSSQPAAQHSTPPAAQDKQQCVRERSDSTQSVEAMVCDEDEEIIRPTEEPVRSAWSEQVISGLLEFHVGPISSHIYLLVFFRHIPPPTLDRYKKFDIPLVSWDKSYNRVTKFCPKSQHFH